ncbi:MAG: DUF47 family protein [Actinobacteria bacterium]|nr:DUF47 family protein [Actinomycetota bacterium]
MSTNGKKIKKRKSSIQSLLDEVAVSLPEATSAFVDLVSADPEQRGKLAKALHAVESAADERYLAILHKVGESFITPYDREDIYEMVEALDDVVDQLDHAGQLLARFSLGALPEELVANARTLHKMAQMSHQTIPLIKHPKKLEQLLIEINTLENEMDERYRDLLVEMLDDAEARDAIKIKIIADCVEAAATNLDKFGRSVGLIAIKET